MIRKITLSDFRNYSNLFLAFNSKLNLILGENGQGKTNLLEAIYYLAFLRSFRTNQTDLVKKVGSSSFYVGGEISYQDYKKELQIFSGDKKKLLKIDGNCVTKASDFIGFIKPVVFTHDDIRLITCSARTRRRYLDILLTSIDKTYLNDLHNYLLALKSRNFILKSNNKENHLISAYEPILAKYGKKIIDARYAIISNLLRKADSFLKKIKGDSFNLELEYHSRIKINHNTEEDILNILISEREKDKVRTYTSIGPHMDDMFICLNGKNLKNYGSIGQCRIVALCIKMAEAEIIAEKESISSIALIDDVTGELDTKTKDAFYQVADKFSQVFYTFTRYSDESVFNSASIFNVFEGVIKS
ncbi:MAG TPA: hypothetical protein DD381_09555 [Lentisphaeria bacterium]|nr:MAG: hypothetical protein A2X47_07430 [Lentisphaerae bacterium GWF2_38_69]HBM16569.1 hypothetical protein [Lentisphaeria bacterium]